MNIIDYLTRAGVPAHYHAAALASIESARDRAKGLLLHKLKVRLLKAGELAKLMTWEHERLIDVDKALLTYDVAPMQNIPLLGDFLAWKGSAANGTLTSGQYLNKDPESAEYKDGVAINKWTRGKHVRSYESHKGAIRRNGGEGEAWIRGLPVTLADWTAPWVTADGKVKVFRNGNAWLIVAQDKYGPIPIKVRIGYEIDNVMGLQKGEAGGDMKLTQLWHPLPGYELRAPVTWSVLPGRAR